MATSSNPKSLRFIHKRIQISRDTPGANYLNNLSIQLAPNEILFLHSHIGIAHDGGHMAVLYGLYPQGSLSSVKVADCVQLGEGGFIYPSASQHNVTSIHSNDLVPYTADTLGGVHGHDYLVQLNNNDFKISLLDKDIYPLINSDIPRWYGNASMYVYSFVTHYNPGTPEFMELNLYFYLLSI